LEQENLGSLCGAKTDYPFFPKIPTTVVPSSRNGRYIAPEGRL